MINYINNGKTNFRVFIAHRVNEIRNSSKTEEWFYLPRNQTVADDLTRYKVFENLANRSRWCVGPELLHKEFAAEILSINSLTNNKQDDTVLPNEPIEHLKNRPTFNHKLIGSGIHHSLH